MPRPSNRLRDWLFGSPRKRLLLETLLRGSQRRWTKRALCQAVGAHEKGGLDEHLVALVQLGVLSASTERGFELSGESELLDPLRDLLGALDRVPDADLERP
jgi:hypothetical protein